MSRHIRPALLAFALICAVGSAAATSAGAFQLPPNSVGTNKIKNGAVRAADVSPRQVQLRINRDCKTGSAIRRVLRDGSVRCVPVGGGGAGAPTGPAGGDLTGTYPNPELGSGVVGSQELADGSVGSQQLTTLAVLTANLADDAVNSIKVENNSLTGADIDESTLTGFWQTGGNAGTDPATNFLGTTDNNALNFRVNGARALRIEPGISPNLIGGVAANNVSGGASGATISGGGSSANPNVVSANTGTVGGGEGNLASAPAATISGGRFGSASGSFSTISGGSSNAASQGFSTVGGGSGNSASGPAAAVLGGGSNVASGGYSSILGGASNAASGSYSSILGGADNVASQPYTTAIGTGAVADDPGATVFASPGAFSFESEANNEFAVRATGGSRIVSSVNGTGVPNAGVVLPTGASAWNALSDRNSKREIEAVDARDVLAKLADLPIATWSWNAQPGVRHMGPMAQDFRAAFGLGDDPRMISSVDPDGVALAAIQGLQLELKDERRKRLDLEERLTELEREFQKGD